MTPEEKIARMRRQSADREAAKKRRLLADYARFKALCPDLATFCENMKARGTPVAALTFQENGEAPIRLR